MDKVSIISEVSRAATVAVNLLVPAEPAILIISTKFQINSTEFYVPMVTLSINNNTKLLENLKQRFKSKITTKSENYNLCYMIDSKFMNINRLLILSFKNYFIDPTRNSYGKYYIPLGEIIHFSGVIDNKSFFMSP